MSVSTNDLEDEPRRGRGVRIERSHSQVVTEDGCELLTHAPKELVIA